MEALATSEALICTAGNQIVGEACHLGKPVLAIPEAGNWEQAINAHFIGASGAGEARAASSLDAEGLRGFLDSSGRYGAAASRGAPPGNDAVLENLLPYLGAAP